MIGAIILAAGRSRRMGAQKVLLPFAGRTVIGHIAGEILRSPVAEAIVVVGPGCTRRDPARQRAVLGARGRVPAACADGSARIAEALPASRVRLVPNPDADGDMLSSVRCGLRALPSDCEAVLVALGDQPSITADLVGRMIDAFRAAGRGIVVPVYGGRPGHPMLFSARYREEVLTRYDGVGLCGLRQAHPEDVFELGVTTPSVLADMDWPEDYRRELAEFHPGPSPDKPEC